MFITFEGIDGIGKSTHIRFANELLQRHKITTLVTREPGGTVLGDKIRALLMSESSITPTAELLLMFASRAQHLQEVICPALKQKKWILCDRFIDSTYAYQGAGRGLAEEIILTLERTFVSSVKPNYTIVFEGSIKKALERALRRNKDKISKFDKESIYFFEKVQRNFLERARENPQRYQIINVDRDMATVQAELHNFLLSLIPTHA